MIKQHLVISLLLFVNLVLQGVDQHKGFWEPSGGVFRKVFHTHVAFNKKNKNIYHCDAKKLKNPKKWLYQKDLI